MGKFAHRGRGKLETRSMPPKAGLLVVSALTTALLGGCVAQLPASQPPASQPPASQLTFDPVGPVSTLCGAPAVAQVAVATFSPRQPVITALATNTDQFSTPGIDPGASWRALSWTTSSYGRWPGLEPPKRWKGGFFTLGFASGDGLNWKQSDLQSNRKSWLVVPSHDCLVAYDVGSPSSPPLTSGDGLHWDQHGVVAGLGELPVGTMLDSVAAGPNGYVALLHSIREKLIAVSSDGSNWELQPGLGQSEEPYRLTVQYAAGRFIAIFQDSAGYLFVENSPDGRTWLPYFGRLAEKGFQLAETSGGLLLVIRENEGTTWWWSSDAEKWAEVSSPGALGGPTDPASSSPILADVRVYSDGQRAIAWSGDGRMWVSMDGRAWKALAGAIPNPQLTTFEGPLVFPRGIMVGDKYAAAS